MIYSLQVYTSQAIGSENIMATTVRWTSADLEALPEDDGKRYEIIDGELCVSKQPHWHHQFVCAQILGRLQEWSNRTGAGRANLAPGIVFSEDNDVAPDLVWISTERLAASLGRGGHLHAAPELIVEVLSPGAVNEWRDREVKLKLYSRRAVQQYWIVDWQLRKIEIYRRENLALQLVTTLREGDVVETSLLPGFSCSVTAVFENLPT